MYRLSFRAENLDIVVTRRCKAPSRKINKRIEMNIIPKIDVRSDSILFSILFMYNFFLLHHREGNFILIFLNRA